MKIAKRVRISKKNTVLGTPIVTPRALYLGTDEIFRLRKHDLQIEWNRYVEYCGPAFVIDTTLIANDGVGQILGLDVDSGATMWSRDCLGAFLWRGQLLSFDVPGIVLLSPATGKALDQIDLPARNQIHDLHGDVLLYERGQHNAVTVAFHVADQRVLWERPLFDDLREYHALERGVSLTVGEKVYVLRIISGTDIFGCSMETGEVLWHFPVEVPYFPPSIVDGDIYFLTQGLVPTLEDFATFTRLDGLTGEVVYRTKHKELLADQPMGAAVATDHIFFGTRHGRVLAFRLSDGHLEWSHRCRDTTWEPAFVDDCAYIATDDGYLTVFCGRAQRKRKKDKG